MSPSLRFETIDLPAHGERCVAFRRDSYLLSFGTAERFDAGAGANAHAGVRH